MVHALLLEGNDRRIISDNYLLAGEPDYQHVKKLLRKSFVRRIRLTIWRSAFENCRHFTR